jgi:hypothetical protein
MSSNTIGHRFFFYLGMFIENAKKNYSGAHVHRCFSCEYVHLNWQLSFTKAIDKAFDKGT